MKTIEKRESTHTYDVLIETKCDLCGDVTKNSWQKELGNLGEIEVRMLEGSGWQDGGSDTRELAFDVCPKCFTEKLMPWMKSQGAEPTITERDS
jgi:hypothetical protein